MVGGWNIPDNGGALLATPGNNPARAKELNLCVLRVVVLLNLGLFAGVASNAPPTSSRLFIFLFISG
jgi:hypothetical protein